MILARKFAERLFDVVVRRISRNPERGVVIFEFDGHFVIRRRISLEAAIHKVTGGSSARLCSWMHTHFIDRMKSFVEPAPDQH
jgi:hypothetical protein